MIKIYKMVADNPWWVDDNNIYDDPVVKAWAYSELHIVPEIMHTLTYDFDTANTVVYTLRGAQQIGKTTMMKLQVRKFIEEGKLAGNIFYYSFDPGDTIRELIGTVNMYMKLTNDLRDGSRCYFFLDDISNIPNWQNGIKWLVDKHKITNCTIMVADSYMVDLMKFTKHLPGRRETTREHYDKILLPLSFSEYASVVDDKIKRFIDKNDLLKFQNRRLIFENLVNNGDIDRSVELIYKCQSILDRLLDKYMYSGGIPSIMNNHYYASKLQIPKHVYENYMNDITEKWSRFDKNQNILKRIGMEIANSYGHLVSWHTIARNADIEDHNNIVQQSVQILSNLFISLPISRYDMNAKSSSPKKIYFVDPFLFHLFNGWSKSAEYYDTSVKYLNDNKRLFIESIIASHLARFAFHDKQSFDYHSSLFYYVEGNNDNVDLVYSDGDKIKVPIDVKCKNDLGEDLGGGMYEFLNKIRGKGLVISKDRLDVKSEYVVIPASVFLFLM